MLPEVDGITVVLHYKVMGAGGIRSITPQINISLVTTVNNLMDLVIMVTAITNTLLQPLAGNLHLLVLGALLVALLHHPLLVTDLTGPRTPLDISKAINKVARAVMVHHQAMKAVMIGDGREIEVATATMMGTEVVAMDTTAAVITIEEAYIRQKMKQYK